MTQQQYDSVKANAAATAATVRADQAVGRAGAPRSRVLLDPRAASTAGRGSIMVQAGNVVKANDAMLVTINQVVPIYVTFAVPERELPGDPAAPERREPRCRSRGCPRPAGCSARGELTFVDNTVDRATGTITLKATFPNTDRVALARRVRQRRPDARHASRTRSSRRPGAVQNGQQGTYAFVVKADDTVESRPVTVARNAADGVVIAKGLAAGETRRHGRSAAAVARAAKIEVVAAEGAAEAKKS